MNCANVILGDELVEATISEALAWVLASEVSGALPLHQLFPAKTLDFFVLFSSCRQLLGFSGQASYVNGNSFPDSLAEHRQSLGDNSIAFQ